MQQENFNKRPLYFVIVVLLVVLAFGIYTVLPRIGKTKVTINVAPSESQIIIDGTARHAGEIYLEPGDYTITAQETGFKEATEQVSVEKEDVVVNLLPEPNSVSANLYFKRNPDEQKLRESIGGQIANSKGQELIDNNKLIEQLPYTDVAGPFTIDYGPSPNRKNGVFYIVSDSSPEGRLKAVKWIKSQGFDISDLEIQYDDFKNPLLKSGSRS